MISELCFEDYSDLPCPNCTFMLKYDIKEWTCYQAGNRITRIYGKKECPLCHDYFTLTINKIIKP